MVRAIVIQPPLLLSSQFIDYPYFSMLGAYQAAAVLADAGLELEIIDAFARPGADLERLDEGTAWLGEPREVFLERLKGAAADLVLIASNPFLTGKPGIRWLRALLGHVRDACRGPVVLADMHTGGMHYLEYDPRELLQMESGPDLILRYECERLLGELAAALRTGERPAGGIRGEHAPFALDDVPLPDFARMDAEAYFDFLERVLASPWRPGPIPARPGHTLPLVTARGCPYGCIFCSKNPGLDHARTVRSHPWERVHAWLRDARDRLGLERVAVLDEIANLDPARFGRLLDALEELDIQVAFPNGLRADRLEEDHVRRLKARTAGLKVSLESASARVQREVLGKNLDPASVERVAGWCRRHGLGLEVHVLIGIPGERREEVVATLREAARLRDAYGVVPRLQFATPLPGTPMERLCREQGLLAEDPEDLHACFQGRSIIRNQGLEPGFLARAMRAFERTDRPAASRKVIVNLTYRCNNRCVFCAVGDRAARDADPDQVVSSLRAYRERGYELLDIDGGEPTLHPSLLTIVDEARRLGYRRITVVTNGRRLSYPAYARGLVDAGVDEVLVSLHASGASLQARITRADDSFAQTTAGIRNTLELLRDPDSLAVNTTIVHHNLDDLHALGDLLGETGVRRWNLQVVTPFGRAEANQLPDQDRLGNTLRSLLSRPPAGMHIQVINCPPCLLGEHAESAAVDFGKAGRDMVFVGERGENLQAYLSHRRARDARCTGCPWSISCPGFYLFDTTAPPESS